MPRLLSIPPRGVRRKENTRERIVSASLDVFVDKGLDGARIDDITKAAGFTRGAFYSNFSKKEEVFDALFASVTDQVIAMIRDSFQRVTEAMADEKASARPGHMDSAAMLALFEAIRPHGRQWYLLYSEAVAHSLRHPDTLTTFNAHRTRMREAIAQVLEDGMERNGERSTIPPLQLAQTLVGVFIDLMVQEQLDGWNSADFAGPTILGVLQAFIVPDGSAADERALAV